MVHILQPTFSNNYFVEGKKMCFDKTKSFGRGPIGNKLVSSGLRNGLTPNRWQVFTQTNADSDLWRHTVSMGHLEMSKYGYILIIPAFKAGIIKIYPYLLGPVMTIVLFGMVINNRNAWQMPMMPDVILMAFAICTVTN